MSKKDQPQITQITQIKEIDYLDLIIEKAAERGRRVRRAMLFGVPTPNPSLKGWEPVVRGER